MPQAFRYEVEGKIYHQKKLVLGQVAQLMELLKEIKIPLSDAGSFDPHAVADILGDKVHRAVAIVLIEDGVPLKDKDLEALTREVSWTFDLETTLQVIEDFFACNPIASLLERYIGIIRKVWQSAAIGSPKPVSSSPKETSPGATPSSGGTPPTSTPCT